MITTNKPENFNKLLEIFEYDLDKIISNNFSLSEKQIIKTFFKLQNVPVSFFLKKKSFYDFIISVFNNVYSPRLHTESLVEHVLKDNRSNLDVLELGTGSGAISVAISKHRKSWNIVSCDISADALKCARLNLAKHNCFNVFLRKSSWYSNIKGHWDIIVSNPPYLDIFDNVHQSVFTDPMFSLYAFNKGLSDLFAVIKGAKLNKNGKIILEHKEDQFSDIAKFMSLKNLSATKILNCVGCFVGSQGIYLSQ